jgi:hypothetical protein
MEPAHQATGYVEERVEQRLALVMVGTELACIVKEEVMVEEGYPLPVAMRNDEISERDLELLQEAAKTTPSVVSRLKHTPYRMPERHRVAATR